MLRTPFYQFHVDHDANMVDFAGWEMPILYQSIREEHRVVREQAGMFDVSHMGRVRFSGRHARRFLERILTRRVSDMQVGQCRYSLICNEQGGTRDDVVVFRFDDHWLMIVNAANRPKLLEHFETHKGDLAVKIEDQTQKTAMVAIQGPRVMEILGQFSDEIPTLKRFRFTEKNLLVVKMTVSRTGYTGEDGVEVILPAKSTQMALKLLMREGGEGEEGGGPPIRPVGLGARDTLRLEAGMPLYGHELTEQIDPISAGLKFAVSLDKDQDDQYGDPEPFIGQEPIKKVAAEGPQKKLVGLRLDTRRTPREHMAVRAGDQSIGEVTSGCLSPTLGYPIAMAYVPAEHAEPGASLNIDFGKRAEEAQVVKLPFYKA